MNQNMPMTPFGMAVVELGLTLDQQERAKALATAFRVAMTDPDIHNICLHVKANGTITEALEKFSALGKEIGADIADKSDLLLSSMSMKIGDAIKEKIDDVPAAIAAKADEMFERRVDIVIRKTNDDMQKLNFKKERNFNAAVLGGFALILILTNGWTHTVSRDMGRQDSAELTAAWKRSDLPIWVEWMRNNDARKLQAQFCAPGQEIVLNGQSKCRVDIATSENLQSTTGLDGVVAVWREAKAWLGFYGALALGAAGALLTLRIARKKRA